MLEKQTEKIELNFAQPTREKLKIDERSECNLVPSQTPEALDEVAIADLVARYSLGERNFRGIYLAGCDLSGVDLSHADLRGANFCHADLQCITFNYADLRQVNFRNASLRGSSLVNCDMTGGNLTDADLSQAHLNGANLFRTTFERVKCYKTSFTGATLTNGSKWELKTSVSGRKLSLNDLLARYEQGLKRRKLLVEILLLFVLYIGFETNKLLFPFVFSLF